MENSINTEQDLRQLIGQYESIRLDFKASALLAQPRERIVKQLVEDVSGFANTEGGVIVIGIREGKSGKKSVAIEIDEGIDPALMSPERLEQLIASNISPAIPVGLTVRAIHLSGPKAGRLAYVVTVPKGSTAYQARHSYLYYTRTEFAAVPLHDSVIRLLMTRGRVPQARVEVYDCETLTADTEWALRQAELRAIEAQREAGELVMFGRGAPTREYFEAPKRDFDQYNFHLAVTNTGEVTLRDFLLSLAFVSDLEVSKTTPQNDRPMQSTKVTFDGQLRYRFAEQGRITTVGTREYLPLEQKLFPGDRVLFPSQGCSIRLPARAPVERRAILLRWTIYLDDAPSSSGELDMADHLKNASLTPDVMSSNQ